MVKLTSFRGERRTLNIVEEIGDKYSDFGINILNDRSGSYVRSLEREFQRRSCDINRTILTDWLRGKDGAKPPEWTTLVGVLTDIGLRNLATEIERSLNV